jgi:hypothetical protein
LIVFWIANRFTDQVVWNFKARLRHRFSEHDRPRTQYQ